MYICIGDKKYEVSTNIGTSYEIEKRFNKKIRDVLEELEERDMEQMISLIYVGFKRKNPDITEENFKEIVFNDENITWLSFFKEVSVFCNLCMSMKSDEKEVRERLDKVFERNLATAEQNIENIQIDEEDEKN